MKLLMAWIGFFFITFLLAVAANPVMDFVNGFPMFVKTFNVIYGLGSLLVFGIGIYLIGKFFIDMYKDYKESR
ncbi:hypothetical protein [Vibrio mediterranei]|uniref:hypothetical protein n=1 Tax=Vibrio mediterranei TaxID=689 RepID=UPI004068B8BD